MKNKTADMESMESVLITEHEVIESDFFFCVQEVIEDIQRRFDLRGE